jgi:hypothetical protein
MLELSTPRGEVADRLGIPTRDAKKLPASPNESLPQDTKEIETVSAVS